MTGDQTLKKAYQIIDGPYHSKGENDFSKYFSSFNPLSDDELTVHTEVPHNVSVNNSFSHDKT